MQATLRECTVLKMNQKFHRGEDKRVTIIQRFKLFRDYRPESKRAEPRFSAAGNYECRWKRGRRQTEREKSGRYQEGMKKKRGSRGKMPYYEFISGFWGRYKSLFGFEYSILKHPSWAGITVPSVPFPGFSSAHRRWALMKIYCTSCRGLHVAFSDDWIENRSLAIALLEPTAGISQTDRMILLIVYLSFPLSLLLSLDTRISRHRRNNLNP